MLELEEAWERARGLIERAGEFGRHDEPGGTIFGWYPTKPGQAPLAGSRIAWLRHTVYDPLSDDELRALERKLERPLPDSLRRFYTECANGVELLGNDVTVYGLPRGRLLDPFDLAVETIEAPVDALDNHVFFGSWGGDRNLLYLDADDDWIHLAALNSVSALRTWESLGEDLSGDNSGDWPVFTVMHGAGAWDPQPVASSLRKLLASS